MKKKFVAAWMLTLVVMLLWSALSVVAVPETNISVQGPNSSINIFGTILLRAQTNDSINPAGGAANPINNITNVTWEYSGDGGASWAFAATNGTNVNNFTSTNWTANFNTNNLSDALTYRWRARGHNGTAGANLMQTSAAITAVNVDNTVPIVSITSPAAGSTSVQGFTLLGSCVNASSATLRLGSQDFSMTMAGPQGAETCTYVFLNGQPAKQIYNDVVITALDLGRANSTATSAIALTVDARSGNKGAAIAASLASQGQTVQASSKGELGVLGSGGTGSGLGGLWNGGSMDWVGAALLVVGILTFVFPPLMAFLPPPFNLAAIVVGLVLVVIF